MRFINKRIFRLAFSLLIAFGLVLSTITPSAIALTSQQKLISEVWQIVNRTYLDKTFNHQNWALVRQETLRNRLLDQPAAYDAIQKMLKSLNDPFTRFLDPQQYRSLQVSTSGELTGVGLQISLNAQTGKLEVIAPIAGSPADKAGIQPQDRILKIESLSTQNLTLDEAAAKMRASWYSSDTFD